MHPARTVGVLGGMGPHATVEFFNKLVTLTPARKDWEHLRIVIDNNPHIPSRNRHFLYGETSPLEGMLESCRKLQAYPVDFIAIPCNSAALFVTELQQRLTVPILNISEVASEALATTYPGAHRAAALGAHGTYSKRSYAPFLRARGIELVDHGAAIQRETEQLIEQLKLSPDDAAAAAALGELIERVRREAKIDAVILACTEFGCLPAVHASVAVVDSSFELAKRTVALARGTEPLPESIGHA